MCTVGVYDLLEMSLFSFNCADFRKLALSEEERDIL